MIHDRNRRNCHRIALTGYGGLTCHKRNLADEYISLVPRVFHNSSSHLVWSCCVSHKSAGNPKVHARAFDVQAFDALASVLGSVADALTRECRKCFPTAAAVDSERFGSAGALSFAELVQLEVGRATEQEPTDQRGDCQCRD